MVSMVSSSRRLGGRVSILRISPRAKSNPSSSSSSSDGFPEVTGLTMATMDEVGTTLDHCPFPVLRHRQIIPTKAWVIMLVATTLRVHFLPRRRP